MARLADELPVGIAAMISSDCGRFEELESCVGVGLSADKRGEDGILNGYFLFSGAEVAQAALPVLEARFTDVGKTGVPAITVEGVVDDDAVRIQAVVDVATALAVISQLARD